MAAMDKLYVPLPPEALEALHQLAERHLRTQRQQAAYLIVEGLKRSNRRASPRAPERRNTTGRTGP